MSSQATVLSVDALQQFRAGLALYGDDTLAALGAVDAEVRRTVLWLEQNRPAYWHEQIKRRREQVSQARADVYRKKLQKRPDYTPPMSEQVENLRKAEASLEEAEKRLAMVRKWQPRLQHAVLEYHASVQRLKDFTATDVPNAALLLGRIVEAIEAYLRVQPPAGAGSSAEAGAGRASPAMESIATSLIAEDIARIEAARAKGPAKAEEPVAQVQESPTEVQAEEPAVEIQEFPTEIQEEPLTPAEPDPALPRPDPEVT
jgi:hypothetical protein